MYKNIKVIGFDADDTLWVNETYFREAELEFGKLMQQYETINQIDQELFKIEIENLPIYGYGVKGFVLSMMETALKLSNYQVGQKTMSAIIDIGKNMLDKPVELLDGVEKTLKTLSKTHRLIMATKGDLLDQERKLEKSGLFKYFHHIEVMSDKKEKDYLKLLSHLDIKPEDFLMIGNSLKSDILPLVNIGANAIHVPFHTTWQHELIDNKSLNNQDYKAVENIIDIVKLIAV
ncbi:MAG: HAD family hydrolase [Marinicellaceae bacterium]